MPAHPKLRPGESVNEYFDALLKFYAPVALQMADQLAKKYEDRGQVDHAIEYLGMQVPRHDHTSDSLYVQAMLKSPVVGHKEMLPAQTKWAKTHAISLPDDDTVQFRPYDGHRKIRVGYLCCWFDSSTIRGQGMPFITEHDRFKFSPIAYSLGPCPDDIVEQFDEFYNIGSLSDIDLAYKVRQDEIDILIEFTGFSPHHRFGAMGARCAPVQISYLNHAGTSGVANVDYVLADDIAAPPEIDQYFTETVYRLPKTFFCFNYDWDEFPKIKEAPYKKNGYITFGCFGSQSKVNDACILLWAKALLATPGSKLILRNMGLNSLENRRFMERRFQRFGISPDRLWLRPGGSRESIKASYNDVDISLDTWPYCGGNTIAESQWMGVPVISLKGDRFPSAYGASLLNASGCAELIAESSDDFAKIAAHLAKDTRKIDDYRKNLRRMMVEHGFGDAKRFAKDMENAYEYMLCKAFGREGIGSLGASTSTFSKANPNTSLGTSNNARLRLQAEK